MWEGSLAVASAGAINGILREHAALLRDVFGFYSISAADMQGASAAGRVVTPILCFMF